MGTTTKGSIRLAVITVAALALMGAPAFAHEEGEAPPEHEAPKSMSVKVRVVPDEVKGYNLFLTTKGFRWAPENVNTKHRKGEGHAHLYVDDVKTTRLYGPAYYLGELAPGTHVIRVTLNGNDHGDYVRGTKIVEAETEVTVPDTPAEATPSG